MTQPAISRHLKVLEDAGLIIHRIDGARRPRRLAQPALNAVEQWLSMLHKTLEKNYTRLDRLLTTIEPPKKGKSR
jgi:DNA-binding transcriptional ArsR family regulator